ncbi:thermonuclease family protein [Candidatus Pelagibacter sp.]|nr:thermonuclease family protein [Candidatus Pelagibacter sp.]
MYLNKRKNIFLISILLIIFIFTINQTKAQEVKVVDGDTIHLDGIKVRFSGIDTPESYYRGKRQQCTFEKVKVYCGYWAKIVLIEKIGNNKVTCIKEEKPDQYNRVLAECFVNNESLSKYLVRSGFAFAYRKYSKKFIEDEEFAKANKLGLWQTEFEFPWDYRKNN